MVVLRRPDRREPVRDHRVPEDVHRRGRLRVRTAGGVDDAGGGAAAEAAAGAGVSVGSLRSSPPRRTQRTRRNSCTDFPRCPSCPPWWRFSLLPTLRRGLLSCRHPDAAHQLTLELRERDTEALDRLLDT